MHPMGDCCSNEANDHQITRKVTKSILLTLIICTCIFIYLNSNYYQSLSYQSTTLPSKGQVWYHEKTPPPFKHKLSGAKIAVIAGNNTDYNKKLLTNSSANATYILKSVITNSTEAIFTPSTSARIVTTPRTIASSTTSLSTRTRTVTTPKTTASITTSPSTSTRIVTTPITTASIATSPSTSTRIVTIPKTTASITTSPSTSTRIVTIPKTTASITTSTSTSTRITTTPKMTASIATSPSTSTRIVPIPKMTAINASSSTRKMTTSPTMSSSAATLTSTKGVTTLFTGTNTTTLSRTTRFTLSPVTDAQSRSSEYVVPNIAHYTWHTKKPTELQFYHLLSLLSTYQNMKPDKIYLHYDIEPIGKYWLEAKRKIPILVLEKREAPTEIFGVKLKEPKYDSSASDAIRVQLMQKYGGVYLDLDIIVLKSLDPLRNYPTTLGYEMQGLVCGGFIMSAPHAPFMYMWMDRMLEDYRVDKWAYISGVLPSNLINRYKKTGIIHVEETSIHYPNWRQLSKLIGPEPFDWSNNYAIHLWHRLWARNEHWKEWKMDPDPESIKKMNNTFGKISRKIYYGSTDIFQ